MSTATGKHTESFPTAYNDIIQRLEAVDPHRYGISRNFISGAVTRLSPYISRGVVSPRQVWESLQARGLGFVETERLVQQLAWREYFQRIWQHLGDTMFNDIRQPQGGVLHFEISAGLMNAVTGIEAIDNAVHELNEQGYLHNHYRLYIASIACNIAGAYWRQPSEWMYYHLLDGDLASNTCSWQWVSGAFATKKYYFNQENLNRYSGSNQHHSFLDVSYEELASMDVPETLVETSNVPLQTKLPQTSMPEINTALPTIIYNSYNLDPIWRASEQANRVLLLEPSHFKRFPVSDKVLEFIIGLSANIPGIQLVVAEVDDLGLLYQQSGRTPQFISRSHPGFTHYPGQKDEPNWLFPQANDFYPSFHKFWKKAGRKGIV